MFIHMNFFEQRIRRYEHMRWAQEPNRRTLPFSWGLKHIGGDARANASDSEARAFLEQFVEQTISHSDDWYAVTPASDYTLSGDNVLTFTSEIASPWPENNRVHAQLFRAGSRPRGPAVVVLAQWNARWEEQQAVCRWLSFLGITAVKMSLPYHDRRAVPGHPRGDHLIGPNIGLTLQANRQAVLDVRRTLRWLEQQGYDRLGLIGTSVGSCIAFITACHETAVHASAHLHAAAYFGEVVANGITTKNVWESLQTRVKPEELRRYWLPISPFPYISKLHGSSKKVLAITGRFDPTFWPEFTEEFLRTMRRQDVHFETMSLPCGHYSLGVGPFKYAAGYRFGTFLRHALA
jgi:hypothetical protein